MLIFFVASVLLIIIMLDKFKTKENWKRIERWKLDPIPIVLWQTYKYKNNLSLQVVDCQKTWINQNVPYNFLDDVDIENFIKSNFDRRTFVAFTKLPLGVMKADMWRYCVLYKKGGIYTDIDTKCIKPIQKWNIKKEDRLIISLENDIHFCQWTIISCKEHPLMKKVIDLIIEKTEDGLKIEDEHFVHKYTGPGIWTEAVKKLCGFPENMNAKNIYDLYLKPGKNSVFKNYNIRIENVDYFNGLNVRHYFGSANFDKEYDSWLKHRDDLKSKNIL